MNQSITVGDALRANLDAANKALDTYIESVIDPVVYHSLHDASAAAKAALEGYLGEYAGIKDLPPVIGERYRDTVARILRSAAHAE